MRREMKMKNYMRSLVILSALLFGAVSEVWAQAITANDIFIQVMPSGKEGKGSVTATEGTVTASVTDRTVTLTVTPANGYKTKKALIIAEKMVAPDLLSAPRRAPGIGTFTVTGPSTDPNGWKTGTTPATPCGPSP